MSLERGGEGVSKSAIMNGGRPGLAAGPKGEGRAED